MFSPLFFWCLLFFHVLFILQLATGIWLFDHHLGFSSQEVFNFYFSKIGNDTSAMSFYRYLESSLPHILSFSVLVFVVTHFISFCRVKRVWHYKLTLWLWVASALHIFSGLLIVKFGLPPILKIFTFFAFEFLIYGALLTILKDLADSAKTKSSIK